MRRRDLILGALLAAGARSALAQSAKVFRLGILVNNDTTGEGEVLKGLHEHGYDEGRNLIVERRYSKGVAERWPALAGELVALKVDAIYVETTPAALAARQASGTIPIVISTAIDPVGAGLAQSLAHPGGNITGLAVLAPEISEKALSLLKEAVPALNRVAVLWNDANPAFASVWQKVDATAHSLGLELLSQPARTPQDFPGVLTAMASRHPDGVLVLQDAFVLQYNRQIVEFALQEHVASVSTLRAFAELGGLMSFGPNLDALARKAADYLDKIFKGQKPADIPFEQPTTFDLVLNLKTAKALGLTIPPLLLAQADQVIE
jgi:putative tryptophan/tyrosine transport system substrate-binding protein